MFPDGRGFVSGRKIARNVIAMATGEAPTDVTSMEMPEMVRTIQDAVRNCNPFKIYLNITILFTITFFVTVLFNKVSVLLYPLELSHFSINYM